MTLPTSPYVYALLDEQGTPYYVGKGRGRRVWCHLNDAKRGKTGPRFDRIRSMLDHGYAFNFVIVSEHGTDKEAGLAERELIAKLKGLTNLTSGGELGSIRINPKAVLAARARMLWAKLSAAGRGDTPLAHMILREAESPSPNVVRWCPKGGVSFDWHCDKPALPEKIRGAYVTQR